MAPPETPVVVGMCAAKTGYSGETAVTDSIAFSCWPSSAVAPVAVDRW